MVPLLIPPEKQHNIIPFWLESPFGNPKYNVPSPSHPSAGRPRAWWRGTKSASRPSNHSSFASTSSWRTSSPSCRAAAGSKLEEKWESWHVTIQTKVQTKVGECDIWLHHRNGMTEMGKKKGEPTGFGGSFMGRMEVSATKNIILSSNSLFQQWPLCSLHSKICGFNHQNVCNWVTSGWIGWCWIFQAIGEGLVKMDSCVYVLVSLIGDLSCQAENSLNVVGWHRFENNIPKYGAMRHEGCAWMLGCWDLGWTVLE